MTIIEPIIETALRAAIRKALTAASVSVPELADAKVTCFWLAAEDGDTNDAEGLRTFILCNPNSAEGYSPTTGFTPQRKVEVEVSCVSFPDSDKARAIALAHYTAVRGVFETAPVTFTFPAGSGVVFGGMLITGGGAGEIGDAGEVISFTVEMYVSVRKEG